MQELRTPNKNVSARVNVKQYKFVSHIFDTYYMGQSGDWYPKWLLVDTLAHSWVHLHTCGYTYTPTLCFTQSQENLSDTFTNILSLSITHIFSFDLHSHIYITHLHNCKHIYTPTHIDVETLFTCMCDLVIFMTQPSLHFMAYSFFYYNANMEILLRLDDLSLGART